MRKRYKKRTGIGVIVFVVLNICAVVAYGKTNLEKRMNTLQTKSNGLDSQIEAQEERKTDIKNLEAYVQTKKYIEEEAREKLGLVYKDEIIFKKSDK